jgi:hypothetical protein
MWEFLIFIFQRRNNIVAVFAWKGW